MHIFKNYKGFKESRINLFRPLTVLIGTNGSGKSNAIEGIELLSAIARGHHLHEITELGRGGAIEVRGGLKSCSRFGSPSFTLGFVARLTFDGKSQIFSYEVTIQTQDTPRIHAESLRFLEGGPVIFETSESGPGRSSADIYVSYNKFNNGKYKAQEAVAANRSVLSQYKTFSKNNRKEGDCGRVIDQITSYLKASYVFDPKPNLMRKYEKIGDSVLQKNGSNLSAVLYDLWVKQNSGEPLLNPADKALQAEREAKITRLRDWICKVPAQEFGDFDFVTTRIGDVMFGLKSKDGTTTAEASILSDGTLRCLAFLVALETVDEGARVVMEEFDNGVHPSRVSMLVAAVQECATRRRLNVLVTTHNPATLNALKDDQLGGVVFSAWEATTQSYRLLRLHDLPSLPSVLESGQLGDLVTRQTLDKYIFTEKDADRKAALKGWADSL